MLSALSLVPIEVDAGETGTEFSKLMAMPVKLHFSARALHYNSVRKSHASIGIFIMETLDCLRPTRCSRIKNPSAHDMTAADLRDAFHLLDSALSILRRDRCRTP